MEMENWDFIKTAFRVLAVKFFFWFLDKCFSWCLGTRKNPQHPQEIKPLTVSGGIYLKINPVLSGNINLG